jgi:hypothetical protein
VCAICIWSYVRWTENEGLTVWSKNRDTTPEFLYPHANACYSVVTYLIRVGSSYEYEQKTGAITDNGKVGLSEYDRHS